LTPHANEIGRTIVIALDAVAFLLLVVALTPRSILRRRTVGQHVARLRASAVAAAISLLSVSALLFVLGLAGPAP
jgi:hypothetical protein